MYPDIDRFFLLPPDAPGNEASGHDVLDKCECVDGVHPVHQCRSEDRAEGDVGELFESDPVSDWKIGVAGLVVAL